MKKYLIIFLVISVVLLNCADKSDFYFETLMKYEKTHFKKKFKPLGADAEKKAAVIIQKMMTAHGGGKVIAAVRDIQLSTKIRYLYPVSVGKKGVFLNCRYLINLPDKYKYEMYRAGSIGAELIINGNKGVMKSPDWKKGKILRPRQVKMHKARIMLDVPVVGFIRLILSKIFIIIRIKDADFFGEACYQIKLQQKDGVPFILLVNKKSFLLTGVIHYADQLLIQRFLKYQKTDGVMVYQENNVISPESHLSFNVFFLKLK